MYVDPQTGVETPTGIDRKFAERLAMRWEDDLNSGRAINRLNTTWQEFRSLYESEVAAAFKPRTAEKIATVFNAIETILPKVRDGKMVDLTPQALSRFQATLRDRNRSETTIAGYLAHLRAALQWAVDQGMLREVPKIKKLGRGMRAGSKAKGRPITGEEFDRMLEAVDDALKAWRKLKREARRKTSRNKGSRAYKTKTDDILVEISPSTIASWQHYLRGLWLSGLRLEESLILYWDRRDRLHVDLTGRRPMLIIPRELEKGGRDRRLPILPDFFAFLLETPEAQRHGPIFNPLMLSGQRANYERACRMVSLIGQKARVVVHTHPKTGKVKFCSAHDLRRSFGDRWARKVPTAVLQKLMRHSSIATTMSYYVDLDADELAEDLYRHLGQFGSVFGSVPAFPPGPAEGPATQTPMK